MGQLDVWTFDSFLVRGCPLITPLYRKRFCFLFLEILICLCIVSGFRNDLFLTWRSRWKTDGLNSLDSSKYSVTSKHDLKLYTNISVDLGPPPLEIPNVSNITKESLFW